MDRSPAQRRVGVLLGHVSGVEAHVPSPLAAVNSPAYTSDAAQLHLVPTHASVQAPAGGAPARPAGSLALKPGDCEALTRLLDHDNHDMRGAMKAFMKADLYKPVRVVGSGQRGGRERGAGVVPRQDLGRRCVSVTHLSNARTHAALRHAPPRGARAGAGAPGRHLRPEVLLGAWARRAQDRVAPPTPAFCCVSNDHETANAARLHCAAHACDETATTLTRAGGAFPSRFPALPLPSSGA